MLLVDAMLLAIGLAGAHVLLLFFHTQTRPPNRSKHKSEATAPAPRLARIRGCLKWLGSRLQGPSRPLAAPPARWGMGMRQAAVSNNMRLTIKDSQRQPLKGSRRHASHAKKGIGVPCAQTPGESKVERHSMYKPPKSWGLPGGLATDSRAGGLRTDTMQCVQLACELKHFSKLQKNPCQVTS